MQCMDRGRKPYMLSRYERLIIEEGVVAGILAEEEEVFSKGE